MNTTAEATGPEKPGPWTMGDVVSIVIPTYNRGYVVAKAVASALAQSYPNLEVVVVDDGSKDDTRDRLLPYLDRIRYVRQENQGVSAARNRGIREARGGLIAFLDSDDVWHPRKLEVQARYLADHPGVGLVAVEAFSDFQVSWPALELAAAPAARTVSAAELVVKAYFAPSGVLVRKECLDAAGAFDPALRSAEDRDLWVRVASRFPVVKLGLPMWCGREHGDNLSTVPAPTVQATRAMLRKCFGTLPGLRGRFFLRQRALSYAAFEASYMYLAKGDHRTALARLLRSALLWPLPFRPAEAKPLVRLRRLVSIVRSSLRSPRVSPPG